MAQITARIIIDVDELEGSAALVGSTGPTEGAIDPEIVVAVHRIPRAMPFTSEELRSAEEAGALTLQLI